MCLLIIGLRICCENLIALFKSQEIKIKKKITSGRKKNRSKRMFLRD